MSSDEKIAEQTAQLLVPITALNGAELVRVKIIKNSGRRTLQIMAERPDGTMDVDLCEKLSREYSLILDVNDLMADEYVLEVSSPGIDRPLTRFKDFQKWSGFEALVILKEKMNNRARFKGVVSLPANAALDEKGDFKFLLCDNLKQENVEFDFSAVASVRLTLSDALLEATKNGAVLHGFAFDEPEAADKSVSELKEEVGGLKKGLKKTAPPRKIEDLEETIL